MAHDQGLRILLAHDLSEPAELAAALVRRGPWPPSTTVRLVTCPSGIGDPLSSFATLQDARSQSRTIRATIEAAHARLTEDLRAAGLQVETATLPGKPERVIVLDAERSGADLVVVGAGGQGGLTASLLGSVSRAVVDGAPCSVLVARSPHVDRLLLATDGSGDGRLATQLAADWPLLAGARVLVVGIGEPAPRYARSVLDGPSWSAAFRDTVASSADQACDVAEAAAASLATTDRAVDVEIRLGDLATEVIAAARAWPPDLVVIGADPRGRLERLFQDSAHRRILDSLDASVLVARGADGSRRAPQPPVRPA
jgi:nucleotide-binding universal stress UspA family protein